MSPAPGGLSTRLVSLCLAGMFVFCSAAFAQEDARAVLAASVGNWSGSLYFMDDPSGQRVNTPLRIEAEMTPDGATLIQNVVFMDPGRLVYAVGLSTIDRNSGELIEASFREGQGDSFRSRVAEVSYQWVEQWRMVIVRKELDGDRPVEIRQTIERRGDSMNSKREVRYLDEESPFQIRDGIELKLDK